MIRVVVVVAALSLLVFYVQRYTLQDHRENTLIREKEIGDAINDADAGVSWRDRLLAR